MRLLGRRIYFKAKPFEQNEISNIEVTIMSIHARPCNVIMSTTLYVDLFLLNPLSSRSKSDLLPAYVSPRLPDLFSLITFQFKKLMVSLFNIGVFFSCVVYCI